MADKPLVLIVDEKEDAEELSASLNGCYRIGIVTSGPKALRYVQRKTPDLILLDSQLSRQPDGQEICRELKQSKTTGDIPVIFTLENTKDESRGFALGASDCLAKPFEVEKVRARVAAHVSLRQAQQALLNYSENLEAKVQERTQELRETQLEIVERLACAAEYRDPETGVHIIRMAHYAAALARAVGLSEQECDLLLHAAPMHDVGKIGIPDRILLKPGKLDPDEWEIMKTHTSIGEKVLAGSKSPLLQMAAKIALTHQEKWDGSGYPKKLKGEEIPLSGRIVAVCDVFDALTMQRPYKKSWPVEKALAEIDRGSGHHFDPQLAPLFRKILPEILGIKAKFDDN